MDPTANDPSGNQDNIVAVDDSGRPTKKKQVAVKEKRVPDDKRSTTPFMTKYERARVLGTRALQIRYVTGAGLEWSGIRNYAWKRRRNAMLDGLTRIAAWARPYWSILRERRIPCRLR